MNTARRAKERSGTRSGPADVAAGVRCDVQASSVGRHCNFPGVEPVFLPAKPNESMRVTLVPLHADVCRRLRRLHDWRGTHTIGRPATAFRQMTSLKFAPAKASSPAA